MEKPDKREVSLAVIAHVNLYCLADLYLAIVFCFKFDRKAQGLGICLSDL